MMAFRRRRNLLDYLVRAKLRPQGHPTVRFGEYLFGRPKIACDIRIQLQRKLGISLAKHYHGLS